MSSVIASGLPLKGTWTATIPVLAKKRSALIWTPLPTPAEAKLNEPGLALAAATRSPTVLKPRDGETTSTFGDTPIGITADKSRAGSNVRFGCNSGLIVSADEFTRRVYPSGSDLATKELPIVVPAPLRFSTTTG